MAKKKDETPKVDLGELALVLANALAAQGEAAQAEKLRKAVAITRMPEYQAIQKAVKEGGVTAEEIMILALASSAVSLA